LKWALQHHLTGYESYMDSFQMAKEIGFDGVEVTHFGKPLDATAAAELRRASDAAGLEISAICGGYRHWIGHFDEEKRLEAVADICVSLRHIAEIGANGLIAPAAFGMFSRRLPPFTPPRDEQGDREALTDSLKRIAEAAEKYNVVLYLEPLNRYEDHMINTVEQAVSLIQAVGSRHLQVIADFFHMNVEEADIVRTIETSINYVGYFHLADSNRFLPGHGHTDFASALLRLKDLQFKGFLSLECGVQGDRRTSLNQAINYLRKFVS